MSPRILDVKQCPHCGERLGSPVPRVCPACGGSLQKRYLSLGCLSTAPVFLALATVAARGLGAVEAEPEREPRASAATAPEPDSSALRPARLAEAVAIPPHRP